MKWRGPRLINFIGIDGAGKTTHAWLLARTLESLDFKVEIISVRGSGLALLLLPLLILFRGYGQFVHSRKPFDTFIRELDIYLPKNIASGVTGKLIAALIWLYALLAVTLRVKLVQILNRDQIIITDRFLHDILVDLAAFTGNYNLFEQPLFRHPLHYCGPAIVVFLHCEQALKRKTDIPGSTYLLKRSSLYQDLLSTLEAISIDTSRDINTTQRFIKKVILDNCMPHDDEVEKSLCAQK